MEEDWCGNEPGELALLEGEENLCGLKSLKFPFVIATEHDLTLTT